jgi:hypothetical protein
MTAPRDPDDLASALLDGLLTDDEAAAARRDPAVAARLAELAEVREAVGRPPAELDPAARERGLAAALAAYDAADGTGEGEPDEAVRGAVTAMGRARAAAGPAGSPAASGTATPWRPRSSTRRRWLTAAAVILVVVGLGALARNWDTRGDGNDTAAQEAATDKSSNEAGAADSASEGAGNDVSTPSGGESSSTVDLGDVDSSGALADRARTILARRLASPEAEASGGDTEAQQGADGGAGGLPATCRDAADSEPLSAVPDRVVLAGHATLDGEPVDVWVLDVEGEQRLVAVDGSCAVVVDRPLQD